MMFRRITLIMMLLTIALSACKKDKRVTPQPVDEKTKLPAITATGAGTFGAIINNKAFLGKITACTYTYQSKQDYYSLRLTAVAADNSKIHFDIPVVSKLTSKLTLTLNNMIMSNWRGEYTSGPEPLNFYQTTPSVNGTLTIETLDEEKKIMSGSFLFKAENSDGSVISITDGRYDTHYTFIEK